MTNTLKKLTVPAAQALAILENNKVMSPLVNNGYIAEFSKRMNGYERGNTIALKVPPTFTAELWDGSTATAQNISEGEIALTLTDMVQIPIAMPVDDMTFLLETFNSGGSFTPEFINRVLNPMMEEISDYEDAYVLKKAAQGTPYYYGTPGSTPDAVSDVTGIRKVLNNNKCPMGNRSLILSPDADEKFLQLDTFIEADKSGTPIALQEAVLGRKYGFNIYMDQNVYSHTKGTLAPASGGTIAVKGAVSANATSLTLDSATLTGTLVVGDILKVTDAVSSAVSYLVVTALATAAANEIAVSVKPADIAIANDSTVTVVASHVANLAFNRDGIFHVSLPTAVSSTDGFIIQNPYTGMGLTIRVEGSTIAAKSSKICAEMYIATATRKECVARLLG
jgi:hypothetical protein